LFRPIRLGPKESRNRVMRLATTTNTGDAYMPRRLAQAIAEGHRAGRAVS
jgi:hypothetical protein